ncbi:phage tail protein [Nitrosomonas sp.]|uniref:phage tail protein n=1 Tax=Nitrosomonas sp. TaxID=42353 RepID=UPI00261246C4|nr:phage tail protein [Nitrosomonas sp.]MCW5599976.1 phage tail protein [Nitrosomonas sp.]
MANPAYQTVGFHFSVTFYGLSNLKNEDVRFQSVSGLDVQFDTESWREGGENRFTHELPGRSKFSSSLTLKRGLIKPKESGITDWCIDAFVNKITPLKLLSVELLDEKHGVLVKWDVEHVWPKSWKIGELNAERSEVLIETLELNYNRFTYKTP